MAVQTREASLVPSIVCLRQPALRHPHQKAPIRDRSPWHLGDKRSFHLSMMAVHSFDTPWTESQNSILLEEEIERANWARPSEEKPWESSLERQGQDQAPQLSGREALVGLLLSFLVATVLGQVDAIKSCLHHIYVFRNVRYSTEAQTWT